MLTHYALEVMVKERLREYEKEIMTRQALRAAFGDRRRTFSLFRKLWCALSGFLAGARRRKLMEFDAIELPAQVSPCMATK
jgi:hypothetical protein